MSAAERNTEDWQQRAPSQRDRILDFLRAGRRDAWNTRGWICSVDWPALGIRRGGARIWELRHQDFHRIEEEICAEHKVARYRLVWDAERDRAE